MYIGPWQEYKLAEMIKVKNDIYEGKGMKLSNQALTIHDSTHSSMQRSKISTPSTRSFSSEPVQKPYPTFNLDTYYRQWKRVETIISSSEHTSKKPPLPKQSVRKRQAKSIQEKRVNQMRVLYGIENKNSSAESVLTNNIKSQNPADMQLDVKDNRKTENTKCESNAAMIGKTEIGKNISPMASPQISVEMIEECKKRKGFSNKLKDEIRNSENYVSLAGNLQEEDEIKSNDSYIRLASKFQSSGFLISENKTEFPTKIKEETKEKKRFSSKFKEEIKKSQEILATRNDDHEKVKAPPIHLHLVEVPKPKKLASPGKHSKFACISKEEDLEVIEESLNQENIDGLLQWVENLPDELSSSPLTYSKGFIL